MQPLQQTDIKVVKCPSLLIAAPSSGSGKTTLTAALARYHVRRGLRVSVFKAGPDFIDPMILRQACGNHVYSLDFGMMSEEHCQDLLYHAAEHSDLILIEGVMGLYDGQHCAADIAKRFNLATAVVVDVRAMAETFAAVAHGLTTLDPTLKVLGAFANRTASEGHANMAQDGLQRYCANQLSWLGHLPFNDTISFPERHLGLVQAAELQDIEQTLDNMADLLEGQPIAELPPEVRFAKPPSKAPSEAGLLKQTIAIAQDQAFSFVYQANIDFLQAQGARVIFTSPLKDKVIPECDLLYLPGGYPELYAQSLASNTDYLDSIRAFSGKILAECGGMIYLSQTLTVLDGTTYEMCGRLPIKIQLHKKLQAIGWQHYTFRPEGEFEQEPLKAHSFHYTSSHLTDDAMISGYASKLRGGQGEAIYQQENITASYLHWYFPSNPSAALTLLGASQTSA